MFDTVKNLLSEQGIDLSAPISLLDCTVKRSYLLERHKIGLGGSAIIFAIPYHSLACEDESRNISRYAVGRDYHRFIKDLADTLIPTLETRFPTTHFALFSDHSPIDEREAAAKAGLGIIGRNGLLITKSFSSYVFLGEIVTDKPLPQHLRHIREIEYCENCGACHSACPFAQKQIGECLSALTQKKGMLTANEERAIVEYGSAWGCDICQEVCPHTKAAANQGTLLSPISYFTKETLSHLTYDGIREMSERDFSERAFAWRGREVILRNLAALERERDNKEASTSDTEKP